MSDKILIGSDHGGFLLKQYIIKQFIAEGYEFMDYGCYDQNSVDYPDIIHPLASAIDKGKAHTGIIMCGSGNGVAMVANKYRNVRAALCWDVAQTKLSRQHNNANILSLPGRFIDFSEAWEMVKTFISTEFEGGRHENRVLKIGKIIS
ncbi:MAG: ribose 5-phosphate isomerase B [Bacteroidia bacterium]|nr:ribose 5-phosphate isomerase B [Bacteroidales bacterium]MDD3011992.1 ribose 5-phosphate isomerase B [Bacteroidales bacterium]MDY0287080.1 ribose 5-phosphate isomerase B [Bacteroidales bacterium]NCD42231.1 ribose 5-phosphate isomerase B [Bacteroidia bacterium]HPE87232.1 ribose 5-phosphate isomerase B [Bacteroidales bacterium]